MSGPAGAGTTSREAHAQADGRIRTNARSPERDQHSRAFFLTDDDLHGWRLCARRERDARCPSFSHVGRRAASASCAGTRDRTRPGMMAAELGRTEFHNIQSRFDGEGNLPCRATRRTDLPQPVSVEAIRLSHRPPGDRIAATCKADLHAPLV